MFTTLRGSVAYATRASYTSSTPRCFRWTSWALLLFPHCLLAQHLTAKSTIVPEGTPVQLELAETISSAHARKGDRVEFVVLEDVHQDGVTVIRAGSKAWGSVTEVHGKRPFGVPGRLSLAADSVEMENGEIGSLRADMEFKGHRHLFRMLAGMIGAGLIYLPAAPAMLLTRGGDSYALKTTETTAYLSESVQMSADALPAAGPPQHGLDAMLNFLPPRVFDGRGREGDMVNLVFVAPQSELQQAFEHAGWTSVDMSKHVIAWHLLCHGTHYARLPMAHFFLFGRAQDFSFSMPDPLFLLSRRHHIRIWKTDYLVDNTPVWIAAATHDVSIAMHKMRVTHRIDPQVDAERDFIADNLSGTRLVAQTEYVPSQQPVFEATTAGGQPYYSDSRILLVKFAPAQATGSSATAAASVSERSETNAPKTKAPVTNEPASKTSSTAQPDRPTASLSAPAGGGSDSWMPAIANTLKAPEHSTP